ncbi:MAG TPA: ATP-binding protein [Streptosporangiaceae bacterium]|nr:ATP-binding protein [Streptosporangiaceae bacterium]
MNVKFCLAFPCEAVSVPVMRRVLGDTLRNFGVVDDCIDDILVAVSEACTNVLRHGGSARRYEVVTSVGPSGCLVEVVDSGPGFSARAGQAAARPDRIRGAQPTQRASTRASRSLSPDRAKAPGLVAEDPDSGRERREPAKNAALAEDPVREPVRSARRRTNLATAQRAYRPTPSAPRVDDRVIARLPESGRGLQIMRALVDDVTLQSGPGRGTVVSMRKQVAWRRDAPLAGLSGRKLRHAG